MTIHRKFSASCDCCDTEFTMTARVGWARTISGVAQYSSDLRHVMKHFGWQVGNTIVCPSCRTIAIALKYLSKAKQAIHTTPTPESEK
jgi:hypothetical protein